MSGEISLFDPVERFVVGTVGVPGERTFFLQARTGLRIFSVSVEKSQVAALAERISQILREVRSSEPLTAIERTAPDSAPLENPIDEEFRVGVIGIAYLADRKVIEIDLQEVVDDFLLPSDLEIGSEEEELLAQINQNKSEANQSSGARILRVILSLGYSQAFAKRAITVVDAGRQACPFCGGPIDPSGHLCPRANGYRR